MSSLPANIHMGYIGGVKIGGTPYFMSGSSINPNQTVEAPDLVAGWEMRRGWTYGKVDVGGNVSGPLHEYASSLWDTAFLRTTEKDHLASTVDIEIAFYQSGGWKFADCVINSLQISATAGEVVQFTVDFAGKHPSAPAVASTDVPCSRLMTWDRCTFSTTVSGIAHLQSINFTLNNNVQKLYAIQSVIDTTEGLYPVDLPCGVREITGSLSAYADGLISGINTGADAWGLYTAGAAAFVTFAVDPVMTFTFQSVFHRPTGSGQTGATIYSVGFTGVCGAS